MKRFYIIIAIILVLTACSPKIEDTVTDIEPVLNNSDDSQDLVNNSKEQTTEVKDKEPQQCNSTRIAEDMQAIEIEYVNFTNEGFSVKILTMDKDKEEIIPVTGNVVISVYSSEEVNGDIKSDTEVYKRGFYVKSDDVAADCAPKPLTISYSKYNDTVKFRRNIPEGNKGLIVVEFVRTGSSGKSFTDRYIPKQNTFLK